MSSDTTYAPPLDHHLNHAHVDEVLATHKSMSFNTIVTILFSVMGILFIGLAVFSVVIYMKAFSNEFTSITIGDFTIGHDTNGITMGNLNVLSVNASRLTANTSLTVQNPASHNWEMTVSATGDMVMNPSSDSTLYVGGLGTGESKVDLSVNRNATFVESATFAAGISCTNGSNVKLVNAALNSWELYNSDGGDMVMNPSINSTLYVGGLAAGDTKVNLSVNNDAFIVKDLNVTGSTTNTA